MTVPRLTWKLKSVSGWSAQQEAEIKNGKRTTSPGIANLSGFSFIRLLVLMFRAVPALLRMLVSLPLSETQIENEEALRSSPKHESKSGTKAPSPWRRKFEKTSNGSK